MLTINNSPEININQMKEHFAMKEIFMCLCNMKYTIHTCKRQFDLFFFLWNNEDFWYTKINLTQIWFNEFN